MDKRNLIYLKIIIKKSKKKSEYYYTLNLSLFVIENIKREIYVYK